jgi:hypothetical protein
MLARLKAFVSAHRRLSVVLAVIMVLITLLGAGLALALKDGSSGNPLAQILRQLNSNGAARNLPDCASALPLTAAPVAEGGYDSIIPLGNFNPPDHTIPTDHMYYVFKRVNDSDPQSRFLEADVFSPGEVHVLSVNKVTTIISGEIFSDDYQVDFYPCADLELRYDHLTALSDKLIAAISSQSGDCQESHPRPADTYRYCRYSVDVAFSPGEKMGAGGGGSAAGIDLGAYDSRKAYGTFANPSRYREQQFHVACPLDFFSEEIKDLLYERVGGSTLRRTIEPRCGTIYQDISGSLQGNWFYGDVTADSPETWSKSLSLAHDNIDPQLGVIVIGGTFTDPGKNYFTPTHAGPINREFSEVRSSGIYCYSGNANPPGFGAPAPSSYRILIELTSPMTLKIERQIGSCSGAQAFSSPTEYQR